MTNPPAREARLRPEMAALYPGVPAGVWQRASDLGAQLLLWHLHAPRPAPLGDRLLDERHFEFRGGSRRGERTDMRTRAGELTSPL